MKIKSIILFLICVAIQKMAAKEIDTTATISIGGINQFISIKGKNIDNPILLYLHGGPGAAVSSHSDKVTQQLEAHFVVVHWDQRGSGKTKVLNQDIFTPSMDMMKQDAEEMLSHLLKRFERKQLILLGNSWGTILGFHLAQTYPDKVQSLIAVSPIINHYESQQLTLTALNTHFNKTQNRKALVQLDSVRIPISNAKQMLILHRWETVFNGSNFPDDQFEQYLNYFKEWEKLWMPLYNEFYTLDLTTQTAQVECPLFIIQGEKDLTTHYEVVQAFFEKIEAPEKELLWLENTGHNIPSTHPAMMQKLILGVLRK
jgi:pimeloyl-ACP methyl ester carboxylesterase